VLRLYHDLAAWWPLLSPHEHYAEEAPTFREIFISSGLPSAPAVLELGCGAGSNAFYYKDLFATVTLTDLSPQMLAHSQRLNPECEHLPGDMRTLRLDRQFDAVFVHDAIAYMLTLDDLGQALATAYVHCKPGGLALFVPDAVRETFQPTTDHGGEDLDGRSLRYLEWVYDPDPSDTQVIMDFAYLLREGDGPSWVEHDRHVCGLFARAEWLGLLEGLGFGVKIVVDPYDRELFVARRLT
jgi:SAM-dependent methyltransferase